MTVSVRYVSTISGIEGNGFTFAHAIFGKRWRTTVKNTIVCMKECMLKSMMRQFYKYKNSYN